jgi:D-alanine-D-alanine ligase
MKIAVLFGSRSTEHDVSIITAQTVIEVLKTDPNYEVYPVYVQKNGEFQGGGNLDSIQAFRAGEAKGENIYLDLTSIKKLCFKEKKFFGKTHICDIALPLFHGVNGEDGAIQGIFEMLRVPYIGSNILGSALGMDKIAMKQVLSSYNIPITPYVSFTKDDYLLQPDKVLQEIENGLKYPVFIKPANLGSSIGINKALSKKDLESSIEVALHYDSRVICEQGIEDLQEINCAVRGDLFQTETSLLEEPITYKDFLTFEEKYINQGGTMQGVKSKVKIPAELPEENMTEEIQKCAQEVFKILHCSGIARVDFLIDIKQKKFFVNEINTIPGGLQGHLWEKSGTPLLKVLKEAIDTAISRERKKEKNTFVFASEILTKGNIKK